MSNSQPRHLNGLFGSRTPKQRRPAGISRRRKKQFSFEPLESRQVMSAMSLVQPPMLFGDQSATSLSTNTAEGQLAILAREMYWQSLIEQAMGGAAPASTNAFTPPNDPLFASQWHLLNSGQQVGNPDFQDIFGVAGEDINVAGAWARGYTGAGVTVAVIDSGVQLNHPDLVDRINLALALDTINPSGNGNPNFNDPNNFHGTAVAGIIGATANNGIGGAGVAPGVTLVPIRSIDPFAPNAGNPTVISDAFRRAIQEIDITNNSWGRSFGARALTGFSADELLALRDSIIFGRGGLGVIHVFSSGNDAGNAFNPGFSDIGSNDFSAYGVANNRYIINVGGVDHDGGYNNFDGSVMNYPESGPNLLVVAPTGSFARVNIGNDTGIGSGIVTADLTGEYGANLAPNPITGQEFDRDYLPDTDYTSRMNGTSAAAPMVSGVVALMLEANPNLSWRDVQEILLRSARQNAQFEIPATGGGQASQNTWIVNQIPMFHDPDRYSGTIPTPADTQTIFPLLDPNQASWFYASGFTGQTVPPASNHNVADPIRLTNGAGYTVSQGYGAYNEHIGYGHGVVDAEMAVLLAEQWHTKNQALPTERTFSTFVTHPGGGTVLNLPAAMKGSEATGYQVVPGGIGGRDGFISLWEEYYAAVPDFGKTFPYRGDAFMEFAVPDNQTMSIESVDVRVSITGSTAEALDHLRIMLVSPEGTQSELNGYWMDTYGTPWTTQALEIDRLDAFNYFGDPGSIAGTGDFIWTFNTNRSWGERSDNAIIYDPVTGEPVIDELGLGVDTLNKALERGWRLVIENWDANDSFGLAGAEIAWHGSPIAANSQRVQGFVGQDDNRDGQFNYSRVITTIGDNDNDPDTVRLGDVVNEIDLTQESFARNITVTVRRESDNAVVDQFVTGHDGNFYFDLIPGDYIISIEDPEGRLALDDSLTQSGVMDKYRTEWRITEDYFTVWDKVAGSPNDAVVDASGTPVAWVNGNGDTQVTGMKGINFLLDPGEIPAPEGNFSGTVYADANGDGVFNGNDFVLSDVTVYGDVNRNGSFDPGETTTLTDANGNYTLLLTDLPDASIINIGVVPPTQWTVTNPANGLHTRFVTPGNSFDNLNFFLDPPADNIGGGGANLPGILAGVVFEDVNNNGVRNTGDRGLSGFTVYLDANNNAVLDSGERSTLTNQFGAYTFTNVAPGQQIIRIIVSSPQVQSTPANGAARVVNLTGSSSITTLNFGVFDSAFLDFGDLPTTLNGVDTRYDTRPIQGSTPLYDPASHVEGAYWLGASVDDELAPTSSDNADGDDNTGDDENGVLFSAINANSTMTLTVTANRFNGYLQGWIDWNNDGDFADAGERVITDALLNEGQNSLTINTPVSIGAANVFARFRYGEHSHDPVSGAARAINTPWGRAAIGEVEDYLLPVANQGAPLVVGIPADFNGDNDVDGSDFLTWQQNVGTSHGAGQAQGSANGDGAVTGADYVAWAGQFGQTPSSPSGSTAAVPAATTMSLGGSAIGKSAAPTNAATLVADKPLGSNLPAAVKSWIASLSNAANDIETPNGVGHGQLRSVIAAQLSELSGRLRQPEARAELRSAVREFVAEHRADLGSLRDMAFADLAGVRRRLHSIVDEITAEDSDADEAFAALAEQSIW